MTLGTAIWLAILGVAIVIAHLRIADRKNEFKSAMESGRTVTQDIQKRLTTADEKAASALDLLNKYDLPTMRKVLAEKADAIGTQRVTADIRSTVAELGQAVIRGEKEWNSVKDRLRVLECGQDGGHDFEVSTARAAEPTVALRCKSCGYAEERPKSELPADLRKALNILAEAEL